MASQLAAGLLLCLFVLGLSLVACSDGAEQAGEVGEQEPPRVELKAPVAADLEGRIQALEAALGKAPEDGALSHQLGLALKEAGRVEEAVPRLEAAVATLPADPAVHLDLGLAYVLAERLDLGAEHFEAARGLTRPGDHDHRTALFNLAVYHDAEGRTDQAFELLEATLALHPADFEALRFKGVLLQRQNQFAAAAASYEQALLANREDARTVFYLGQAYVALGDRANAMRQVERLRELRHISVRRLKKDVDRMPS